MSNTIVRFKTNLKTSKSTSIIHARIAHANSSKSGVNTIKKGNSGINHFKKDNTRTIVKAIPNAALNILFNVCDYFTNSVLIAVKLSNL